MKVSTEHYMLMKIAFDDLTLVFDDYGLKTLWESAKARANKDPVVLFASFFLNDCIKAIGGVSEVYKHYNDDHLFSALKKIMRENPRVSELMSD